jgi:hypothetical protein
VGQDTPWLAATSATLRLSATACAAAERNRAVMRIRLGT